MSDNCWYKNGIKFSCQGCGGCCSGEPGYVWLNQDEINAIAQELQISTIDFIQKYTRNIQGKISLIEKPNYDCIFLDNNRCKIYNARPVQCSTYPFWKISLTNPNDFKDATCNCPGVNLTDKSKLKLYTVPEINKIATSSTI